MYQNVFCRYGRYHIVKSFDKYLIYEIMLQFSMTRCAICQKKVGILGFECKCDGIFCDKHRMMESHQCPSLLVKSNVVLIKIVADKIQNRV